MEMIRDSFTLQLFFLLTKERMQKYTSELVWSSYYTFGTKTSSEVYLTNPLSYKLWLYWRLFSWSLSVYEWRAIYNSNEDELLNQYDKCSFQIQKVGLVPKFLYDRDSAFFSFTISIQDLLPDECYSASLIRMLKLPQFPAFQPCFFLLQYPCSCLWHPCAYVVNWPAVTWLCCLCESWAGRWAVSIRSLLVSEERVAWT